MSLFANNPTSIINLCKVSFTPTNQIDFNDKSVQLEYFNSKKKFEHECSYQPRSGQITIKGYVDSMLNCNYGYYTNEYNGYSKTFFFWIVGKEFLARNTTQLTIQIDVFQTWLFDFNFTPCMIEREHVDDDRFGIHTIKEDFELGDYVTQKRKTTTCLDSAPCFILAKSDGEGGIFGKTYNGCNMTYYAFSDDSKLSEDIQTLSDNGKGDSIAYIFQFPEKLFNDDNTFVSGDTLGSLIGVCSKTESLISSEQLEKFEFNNIEYIPFNNKLRCYPYMFLTVKSPSGGNVVLKKENFQDLDNISFDIEAVLSAHPTITCTPRNYNGKLLAYDDSISLNDYGLCSWNNDNYANWFAQHKNSINAQSANATSSMKASSNVIDNNFSNALGNRDTGATKGVINTALGVTNSLGSGNFFGSVTGAIGGASNTYLDYQQATANANNDLTNSSLMNTTNYQNSIRSIMASVADAQVQPNTCKGDTSACGLDVARNSATFFIEQTGIKPEYACIIDSYFQMFGYQVNALKVPNFKTREKWNYLKSVNCSVFGDIPQEDCNAINDMFNNGITIWHAEPYMYNYNVENTIV